MSKCMVTAYDDVKIRESNGLYILMELIPLIGFHFRILICFSLMNDENVKFKIKIMMHVKLNKMDTAKIQIHVCLYSPLEEELCIHIYKPFVIYGFLKKIILKNNVHVDLIVNLSTI